MEDDASDPDNFASNENRSLNEATPAAAPPRAPCNEAASSECCDDAISSTTPDKFVEEHQTETDFFTSDLSISRLPTERTAENVEDIVQDLENLLGESNDGYCFNSKALPESYNEINSCSTSEDVSVPLMSFQNDDNEANQKDDTEAMTSATNIEEESKILTTFDINETNEAVRIEDSKINVDSIDAELKQTITTQLDGNTAIPPIKDHQIESTVDDNEAKETNASEANVSDIDQRSNQLLSTDSLNIIETHEAVPVEDEVSEANQTNNIVEINEAVPVDNEVSEANQTNNIVEINEAVPVDDEVSEANQTNNIVEINEAVPVDDEISEANQTNNIVEINEAVPVDDEVSEANQTDNIVEVNDEESGDLKQSENVIETNEAVAVEDHTKVTILQESPIIDDNEVKKTKQSDLNEAADMEVKQMPSVSSNVKETNDNYLLETDKIITNKEASETNVITIPNIDSKLTTETYEAVTTEDYAIDTTVQENDIMDDKQSPAAIVKDNMTNVMATVEDCPLETTVQESEKIPDYETKQTIIEHAVTVVPNIEVELEDMTTNTDLSTKTVEAYLVESTLEDDEIVDDYEAKQMSMNEAIDNIVTIEDYAQQATTMTAIALKEMTPSPPMNEDTSTEDTEYQIEMTPTEETEDEDIETRTAVDSIEGEFNETSNQSDDYLDSNEVVTETFEYPQIVIDSVIGGYEMEESNSPAVEDDNANELETDAIHEINSTSETFDVESVAAVFNMEAIEDETVESTVSDEHILPSEIVMELNNANDQQINNEYLDDCLHSNIEQDPGQEMGNVEAPLDHVKIIKVYTDNDGIESSGVIEDLTVPEINTEVADISETNEKLSIKLNSNAETVGEQMKETNEDVSSNACGDNNMIIIEAETTTETEVIPELPSSTVIEGNNTQQTNGDVDSTTPNIVMNTNDDVNVTPNTSSEIYNDSVSKAEVATEERNEDEEMEAKAATTLPVIVQVSTVEDCLPTQSDESRVSNCLEFIESTVREAIQSDFVVQSEEPALTRNTELEKPLTVEVEDSNYSEGMSKEIHEERVTGSLQLEKCSEAEAAGGGNEMEDNQTNRLPLKMTITKSDNVHSILKIYDPNDSESVPPNIPKLIIKSTCSSTTGSSCEPEYSIAKRTPSESQHSPRLTLKTKTTAVSQDASPKCKSLKPESSLKMTIRSQSSPKLKTVETTGETHHSPKITIKPIVKPPDEIEHGPRITIKPIVKPPEETISEDKYNTRITIKPVVKPNESALKEESEKKHSPRITIKPILRPHEEEMKYEQHSPRITIKPVIKPPEEDVLRFEQDDLQHSPRITIKPIIKPSDKCVTSEGRHSPRITIKPIINPNEEDRFSSKINTKQPLKLHEETVMEDKNPRITIKPVMKPIDDATNSDPHSSRFTNKPEHAEERHSPRITIKPVIKPSEDSILQERLEDRHSPKITIKPVLKPIEGEIFDEKHNPRITIKPIIKPSDETVSGPRITIKPVIKPPEEEKIEESVHSFKLNIKPVIKSEVPAIETIELIDFEDQIKQERIVLKIAKNSKKERDNEKLKKIKLKLSKEKGLAHIVPSKRSSIEESEQDFKHFKAELPSDLTVSLVTNTTMPEASMSSANKSAITIAPLDEKLPSSIMMDEFHDPLADIPVFEITLQTAASMSMSSPHLVSSPAPPVVAATPRKRGRPRKVPLEVREEFKDPKDEEIQLHVVQESTRPKRSCRGPSVRATLGIKPRKPRAPSTRGRGGRRTVSTRASAKKTKESKIPSRLLDESMIKEEIDIKEFDIKDAEFKHVPQPTELGIRDVLYEEETRMSAENSSRAQTPAKQVLASSSEVIEESQSSIQSNTTTESGEKVQKIRRGPRLEVHQEPEGEVISADKLAEYSWGGGGPYMLQEQVAQFLGIKSFKRKYPVIYRRPVDMQERDFIRESCLASEAMCDMGLTAVKSEDILDIMYTDFQNKYEEYCKHQRDRQAKDVSNKQKALSLAASQEKNKLDIVEQAVQSAYQWNASFNKTRREQRRACMDLQTFTIHFPKGKMKQVNKPKIGNYPLALVPGQFTDYYKQYNSSELSNLPLSTMGCKPLSINLNPDTEESQSDGSGSDSDSSSSDSESSYTGSSGPEDCRMCSHPASSGKKLLAH